MSEINWPEALPRTNSSERERCPNGFRVSRSEAFDNILSELEMWEGVTDVQLESGAEHQMRNPNKPYANANFDGPGILVRFQKDGQDMAAGCGRWDNPRDNAQDLYYYLHETRMQEQRGSVTAESEYEKLRLPSGDPTSPADPYHVLGVSRDASEEEIKSAFREKAKETHSDTGGDNQEFKKVVNAKKQLVGEQ